MKANETYMFDAAPNESESFVDFFGRVYPLFRKEFPDIRFSLIEQFGKRASFVAGEADELVFSIVKKNPGGNYWLFFNGEDDTKIIDRIADYFSDIYREYYKS